MTGMRASRLLSIMLLLHVRGRVSATELAAELEVSLRTVYRDIDALVAAGVPVYATRGRAGGYQLLDGYRTKITGLQPDEADALFLAGLPGPASDLGLGSVLAATQLKLLAALPAELRERAVRIKDRFYLDAPGWLRENDAPAYLPLIAEAVWGERRLHVRYERSNRSVVDRVLEPLGLVLKAGTWYLVASAVPDHHGPRAYRVSRVHLAAALDAPFERPAGFDLERHWQDYQRGYQDRVYRERALVRLSPAGRELLFLLGTVAARAARAAMQPADAHGWARTTVPIESVRHASHALLQLGAEVEVLEPAPLRAEVAAIARRMAHRYVESASVVRSGAVLSAGGC